MTNPPQQPGDWQAPSWPPADQQAQQQPYTGPYGAAPGYPSYGYGYGTTTPVARPNNSLAIASLVLALCGLCVGITAPVGAIMGHIARRQIRERGEAGDNIALAGIIVGWVVTALAVIGVVLFIIMVVLAANAASNSPGTSTF